MNYRTFPVFVVLIAAAAVLAGGPAGAANFPGVKRDIAAARYAEAESALVEIAKSSGGESKEEALYLLGGLKRSASEAEIIYREVARLDAAGRWGTAAQVELAKIRYAVGEYGAALDLLEAAAACRKSDEACYFEGLCAGILKRYDRAKESLARVKGEKHRSWAALALADVETSLNNREEACRRYRSIARSAALPTALYRLGECLEERGETESASAVFREVEGTFTDTPEAILAGEKLAAMRAAATQGTGPEEAPRGRAATDETPPLTTGYTLQFGSFSDRTNAIKLAADLKRDLPGVRIDSDLVKFKEVHRVRYGYFKSRSEAERRADEVSRLTGESCAIMPLP